MSSGEETVSCPYNSVHQVLRKHLQKHILQCKLSYPEAELRKCPFNVTHLLPDSEYDIHVRLCPDRAVMTNYKYETSIPTQSQPVSSQPANDAEENWDDDEYESYDPQKYASSAPIIRANIGNLPSQRREFRKNELRRHGEIISDEDD